MFQNIEEQVLVVPLKRTFNNCVKIYGEEDLPGAMDDHEEWRERDVNPCNQHDLRKVERIRTI